MHKTVVTEHLKIWIHCQRSCWLQIDDVSNSPKIWKTNDLIEDFHDIGSNNRNPTELLYEAANIIMFVYIMATSYWLCWWFQKWRCLFPTTVNISMVTIQHWQTWVWRWSGRVCRSLGGRTDFSPRKRTCDENVLAIVPLEMECSSAVYL